MDAALTPIATAAYVANSSHLHSLIDKGVKIIKDYWAENPDLFQLVQLKNQQATANETTADVKASPRSSPAKKFEQPPQSGPLRGPQLRAAIQASYCEIRERVAALNADIIPRTQAHNRKSAFQTLEEEQAFRADLVEAQIQSWRSLLPTLIKKFVYPGRA